MYRRTVFIISLVLISYNWSVAQIDSTQSLKVVGVFDADVAEPKKIPTNPVIEEPKVVLPQFTYEVPRFMYRVNPLYTPAKAIGIKKGSDEDLYGNYMKFGIGNYQSVYGDLYLHNQQSKELDYGGYLHHFSSGSSKPAFADFSENAVGIYGKKFGRKGTLIGRLDYNRDVVHYYGYDDSVDSIELKKKDVNQIYSRFNGNAEYQMKSRGGLEKMNLGFRFYTLSNLGSNENDFNIYNSTWFKVGKGLAGIDADVEFLNLKADTSTLNRTYVTAQPFYKFKFRKFDLKLGLDVVVYGDSSGLKPYVFPDLFASTEIVKDKLNFYGGLNGGIQRNALNDLVMQNPFVVGQPQVMNTIMPLDVRAGLKGVVSKRFDFVLEVRNRLYNDHGFFVSDTGIRRNFQVTYDNLNVLSLRTDVSFNHNQKLFIGLGNEMFNYSNLKTEDEPWQLPAFRLNANIAYTFAKKLNIRLQAYVLGERSQRNPLKLTNNVENLPVFADLNLLAQYMYKQNISFYINVHNVTNSKYQQWYNYGVYGLNVLGGVKFSL